MSATAPRLELTSLTGSQPTLTWHYADPTILLHFEDGANTFIDSATTPNTWTAGGTSGTATESTAQAKFGTGSMSIGGVNAWIRTVFNSGTPLDISSTDFTFECFVYPTAATLTNATNNGLSTVVDYTDSSNGHLTGFRIYLTSGSKLTPQFFGSGGGWFALSTPFITVSTGSWHHVVLMRKGLLVAFGVDGVLHYCGTMSSGSMTAFSSTGNQVYIGASSNSDFQGTAWDQGYIDEVKLSLASVYDFNAHHSAPASETYTVPTAPGDPLAAGNFTVVSQGRGQTVVAGSPETFTDTTATYANTYGYTVFVSDGSGAQLGPASNQVIAIPLQWTYRTTLQPTFNFVFGVACSPGGTAIVHRNGNFAGSHIYRSTDGGASWTDIKTINNGGYGYALYNNGVFVVGSLPGNGGGLASNWVSTDDGLTWANHFTAANFGASAIAGDGGNCIIIPENTSNELTASSNNGTSFTTYSGQPTDMYGTPVGGIVWDGSQFVLASKDAGAAPKGVFTAPGGFSTGPVWTQQATFDGTYIHYGNGVGQTLAYDPAIGYLCAAGTSGVNSVLLGSTPATMASSAPFNPLATVTGNISMAAASHGLAFVADANNNFAHTPDGRTWTPAVSNVANGGEYVTWLMYDPGHNCYIGAGAFGSIITTPAPTALPAAGTTIVVAPTTVTLSLGGVSSFLATTTNPANADVLWSTVYGVVSNGVYSAPLSPLHLSDTVTAALETDPTTFASAAVTLTIPTNPQGPPNGPFPPPLGGFGPLGLRGAFASSQAFAPVMIANAGTINPKIYMPQEATTVKA